MKNLIVGLFIVISSMASAQTDLSGKFIIEPVIGIPNAGRMYTSFIDESIFNDDETFEVTGLPIQLGGRIEYLVKPRVGFGFEVNYENAGFERTYQEYNSITNQYEDVIYSWNQTKIRFLGRFMYHFGNSEDVDWYTGAALGYTHETQVNPENEPDIYEYTFAFVPKFIERVSDPFSARIYLGMRYMFSNNVGLITEVGLGSGSLLTIGLSARFN